MAYRHAFLSAATFTIRCCSGSLLSPLDCSRASTRLHTAHVPRLISPDHSSRALTRLAWPHPSRADSCIIGGCMDSTSIGYDSSATFDTGDCPFIYLGCMHSAANNYWSAANEDDGSCTFKGCTDSAALNYDPSASLSGDCTYPIPGCMLTAADNYRSSANVDSGNCIFADCTDSTASNYDPSATVKDDSCRPNFVGCTKPAALNFIIAPVCAGPTEPCSYDSTCPEVGGTAGGLGCNAGGKAGCRFWCDESH